MPATAQPLAEPVNREAVKVLAKAIGLREAARRMNLSEERVLKWSQRDKDGPWTKQADATALATPSVTGATLQQQSPQSVLKPSEALENALAERKTNIRTNLAKYTEDATRKLDQSDGNLAYTGPAKDLASVYDRLWPEKEIPGVSVQVLNLMGETGV